MKGKWIMTVSAVGVAAYMLADVLHEVVGHGGACLIIGHRIDLISSVYFKSHPGSFLIDLGGPVSNLFFGLLIHGFLKRRKHLSLFSAFLLLNIMTYNLFWFSGTILQSGFSTGDWTYSINELHIGTLGKPVLIIAGIMAYLLSIKITRRHVNRMKEIFTGFQLKQSILYAWLAAVTAAVIAGLFFKYDRMHAAFEGLLEAIGALPIIFITGKQTKANNYQPATSPVFVVVIFVLFVAFCLALGRGIA